MKRIFIYSVIFSLFLSYIPAIQAADTITFDSAKGGNTCGPCSSLTFAATSTNGNSNRILFVGTKAPGDHIPNSTYAAASTTLIDKQDSTGDLGGEAFLFFILAPSTGSNNVVINGDGSLGFIAGTASSYYNVNQITPTPSAKGTVDAATAANASGTTSIDNSWIVATFGNQIGTCSAGSGTNLRADDTTFAHCFGDSGVVTPAGTDNVNMTTASPGNWAWVSAVIQPSGQATTVRCILPGSCH